MAVLATVTAAAAAALVVGCGGVAVEVVFFLSAVAVFVCDIFPPLAVGAGFLPDGFDGSDALVPGFFRRLFPLVLGCSSMMRVVGTNKIIFFCKLLVPGLVKEFFDRRRKGRRSNMFIKIDQHRHSIVVVKYW